MIFHVNAEAGVVVAVLGGENGRPNCRSAARNYVVAHLAKAMRRAKSMDWDKSIRLAYNLMGTIPIEKYVKPVYRGKAKTNLELDEFDTEFGMNLAEARANRAYWGDVAAYMCMLQDFFSCFNAFSDVAASDTISILDHYEDLESAYISAAI